MTPPSDDLLLIGFEFESRTP